MRKSVLFTVLAVAAAVQGPVAQSVKPEPPTFTAKTIERQGDRLIATGNVVIVVGDYEIRTERAELVPRK